MATRSGKDILESLNVKRTEPDGSKVYSGDLFIYFPWTSSEDKGTKSLNQNQKIERERLFNYVADIIGMETKTLKGEIEGYDVGGTNKDIKVSADGQNIELVERTTGGKKLRLKKKTRRAKRNRRTMKRRQLA